MCAHPDRIEFDFKKNQTQNTITGQVIVYVTDPINSLRQFSGVVSFTQPPTPYDVSLAQSSSYPLAEARRISRRTNYVHRNGPVVLSIHGTSGLSDGCSRSTTANGVLALTLRQ